MTNWRYSSNTRDWPWRARVWHWACHVLWWQSPWGRLFDRLLKLQDRRIARMEKFLRDRHYDDAQIDDILGRRR